MSLVTELLQNFATELDALGKSGCFSSEWLLAHTYNRGSRLHSRVWGALVAAVPHGYARDIERRLQTPDRSQRNFVPDLVISTNDSIADLVVELESTNSIDQRVVDRDIDRLRYMDGASAFLLITLMPSQRVAGLKNYFGLPRDQQARRAVNPYAFHRDEFIRALDEARDRLKDGRKHMGLGWANVDVDAVRLEYWNGEYSKRRTWPFGRT